MTTMAPASVHLHRFVLDPPQGGVTRGVCACGERCAIPNPPWLDYETSHGPPDEEGALVSSADQKRWLGEWNDRLYWARKLVEETRPSRVPISRYR